MTLARQLVYNSHKKKESHKKIVDLLYIYFLKKLLNKKELKKKKRGYYGRSKFWLSTWGKLLQNPQVKDIKSKDGKLFRQRFRVPFNIFEYILKKLREAKNDENVLPLFPEGRTDAIGNPQAPIELLVLATLRVLGRGISFDDAEELSGISHEVIRVFFHKFCKFFGDKVFEEYVKPPKNIEEVKTLSSQFEPLGFVGCVGTGDVVHIPWDRCCHGLRSNYVGKEHFPTLAFEVFCSYERRIIACSPSFPGAVNDKSIVKFDKYVSQVLRNDIFTRFPYKLCDKDGNEYETEGAYLIVDNGYFEARILQCPEKSVSTLQEIRLTRWIESVRKTVECVFGILKGRFRILKIPIRFQKQREVENVFKTCCCIHNIILENDSQVKEWETGVNYEGADGLHDIEDLNTSLTFLQLYLYKISTFPYIRNF